MFQLKEGEKSMLMEQQANLVPVLGTAPHLWQDQLLIFLSTKPKKLLHQVEHRHQQHTPSLLRRRSVFPALLCTPNAESQGVNICMGSLKDIQRNCTHTPHFKHLETSNNLQVDGQATRVVIMSKLLLNSWSWVHIGNISNLNYPNRVCTPSLYQIFENSETKIQRQRMRGSACCILQWAILQKP